MSVGPDRRLFTEMCQYQAVMASASRKVTVYSRSRQVPLMTGPSLLQLTVLPLPGPVSATDSAPVSPRIRRYRLAGPASSSSAGYISRLRSPTSSRRRTPLVVNSARIPDGLLTQPIRDDPAPVSLY